jgi:Fe2+ transport system protein FeoA
MNKTLAEARSGEVIAIAGCLDTPTKCMLMRFGLAVGEVIKCIAKIGPVIVGKDRQTIAIGKNLAEKIFVQTA